MALRRPPSTSSLVPPPRAPVPLGTYAGTHDAQTTVVHRPRVPGLLSSAHGFALRLPVAGRVLRPTSSVAGWALRRARTTAAGLVRAEVGDLAERAGRLADLVLPQVVREVLARIDVVAVVTEFVDLDRIAELLDVDPVVARVDVDAVVARVDLDAVVSRLDLDAVIAQVDLDAIVDRLDINAIAAALDLDAVIDRLDIDRAARRLDLDAVISRVDVDAVVSRVDLDAIVDRLDINAIAAALDLDAVIDRLDIDRAAGRLDLDSVIERLDLIGLARYVAEGMDLGQVIRSSTETISQQVVEDVRSSTADADRAVERLVDRLLLRRQPRRTTLTPPPQADDDGHR